MSYSRLKLLFLSTTVGPLGSGLGGGVELTLENIVKALSQRGHTIEIVAPKGSVLPPMPVTQIEGNLQTTAQNQGRNIPIIMPDNTVLGNMWEYARKVQDNFDMILNFAYDWLPFYLTPFFRIPIAHLVSMGSLSEAMDHIIEQIAIAYPETIGVHSYAQGATFSFRDRCRCLSNSIDLSLYEFNPTPEKHLAWVGRISPEKGLEDAVAAIAKTGIPLKIYGFMQKESYWQKIRDDFPTALIEYKGFLPTEKLQKELGKSSALLVTPHWEEAFGNVAIEALACGVPVISYRRGGPSEIVRDRETGFLVEPDSISGLVDAILQLDQINRNLCRQQAEQEFSLEALGDRFEKWFQDIFRAKS